MNPIAFLVTKKLCKILNVFVNFLSINDIPINHFNKHKILIKIEKVT